MKKYLVLFTFTLLTAVILTTAVSANDLLCGELEGIAIQDGYIATPEAVISIPNFYSPQASNNITSSKTLDDYKDDILESWDTYSDNKIDISDLNITTSAEDLAMLQLFYSNLLNDNPEYFYVKSNLSYFYSTATGVLQSIVPQYSFNASEIPGLAEKFNSAVNTAMSLIDESMSDIDKLIALHDFIVLNAEYDIETYETHNNNHPTSFTAYGVLVEGMGVCQSYTLAYSLLLKLADIEVSTVQSSSLSHIWNIVKINGNWYHIDVTWDDPTFDKKGLVTYKYFLASDAEFGSSGATHFATDWIKEYTANSNTYANAFWKSSYSTLAYFDGYYYYTDSNGTDINILRSALSSIESSEQIRSISNLSWKYQGGNVSGGQFRVVPFVFGDTLYYNTADSFYRLCPEFDSDEFVYDTTISDGFIVPIGIDSASRSVNYLNVIYNNGQYVYSSDYKASLDGGHNYSHTIVPPTRDEQGYTEHSCPTCGDYYKDSYIGPINPGDSDGDGSVTALDATLMSRHLAGWTSTAENIKAENIDLNGDERRASIDVLILLRHLAGWRGYETIPFNS